jgi:uroporphyrinogen III methyltransferase/synthase
MPAGQAKPLLGKRVVITRPLQQAAALSERLRELGAIPVEFPTIEIVPVKNADELDWAIRSLNDYDWVIFTSACGVRFFLKHMAGMRVRDETWKELKVAAIGPATAAALEKAGKKADYVPNEYLSEKIAVGLGDMHGRRVLLPRADIASQKLPSLLRDRGALVDDIIAYRTMIPRHLTLESLKSILAEGVDLIIFTSPSTVRNLAQITGHGALASFLRDIKVACIGPVTAHAVEELGIGVDVVAKTHTIDGVAEAIVDEIGAV